MGLSFSMRLGTATVFRQPKHFPLSYQALQSGRKIKPSLTTPPLLTLSKDELFINVRNKKHQSKRNFFKHATRGGDK